jgi:hypothetical protein
MGLLLFTIAMGDGGIFHPIGSTKIEAARKRVVEHIIRLNP